MKIYLSTILSVSLLILSMSCSKEKLEETPNIDFISNSLGFKAQIILTNSSIKNWRTSSANSKSTPLSGIDYFAIRGGINAEELTLISFGKFTDDTSGLFGRLTIFLKSVKDTGVYTIDGSTPSSSIISILNGSNLEHYSSNQNNTGSVTISKYDKVKNIVSGFFEFQLVSDSKIIKVKNGNFTDVPFKQ